MKRRITIRLIAAIAPIAALAAPAQAIAQDGLECVPYARELSGVQIFGNANTWWQQAAGRYDRGTAPRAGAVMVFRPHRGMELGHVAYVSAVIDSRTLRLTHANWSLIDGRRGQIERDVPAVDVSPNNDWSEVRVWYHPIQALGTTRWPLEGFIYGDGIASQPDAARIAQGAQTSRPQTPHPSREFADAFSGLEF